MPQVTDVVHHDGRGQLDEFTEHASQHRTLGVRPVLSEAVQPLLEDGVHYDTFTITPSTISAVAYHLCGSG